MFADVDGDGRKDVIVGAEGGQRVTVLFAPTNPSDLLTASTWVRMDLGVNVMRVMRVALANVAGGSRPEIVVGGKESSGKAATIGYYSLTNPSLPRQAGSWTYTSIRPVGWVMQMFVLDVEGDGDRDIVYTDREPIRVPARVTTAMGLRWLESSGGTTPTWTDHPISPSEAHHKWFDLVRWDGDHDLDLVDCRSADGIAPKNTLWLNNGGWQSWTKVAIPEPSERRAMPAHHVRQCGQSGPARSRDHLLPRRQSFGRYLAAQRRHGGRPGVGARRDFRQRARRWHQVRQPGLVRHRQRRRPRRRDQRAARGTGSERAGPGARGHLVRESAASVDRDVRYHFDRPTSMAPAATRPAPISWRRVSWVCSQPCRATTSVRVQPSSQHPLPQCALKPTLFRGDDLLHTAEGVVM